MWTKGLYRTKRRALCVFEISDLHNVRFPLSRSDSGIFFTVYAVPKATVDFHIHVLDAADAS
jgi:hypothetical protein